VSTTLVASLRKSSCISPSMPARSQLFGQSQSKSHKGLKRPIWAARMRRSRLRRARSSSSSRAGAGPSPRRKPRPIGQQAVQVQGLGPAAQNAASLIGGSFQLIVEFQADGRTGASFACTWAGRLRAMGGGCWRSWRGVRERSAQHFDEAHHDRRLAMAAAALRRRSTATAGSRRRRWRGDCRRSRRHGRAGRLAGAA